MTEILITSSVLIAAILVLRRLLRGRVNPRLQYALWLLVALRLLVPFSVPAATSVMNTRPAEAVQQAVSQTLPQPPAPAASTEQSPAAPLPEATTSQPQPAEAAQGQPVNWLKVVWLGGAALVGAYFAAENLRFYARLKKQRRPLEGTICPLPVYLAGDIPSPCLFGLVRPAVYVTPQAAENPQMLAHVLRHEHCHFVQGDHLWSLVRILCLAVYWFDPLVWAAALCSRTDCELACDRLVTRQLDQQERVAYGRTLVELVQHRQRLAYLACTATTMAAKPSHTKARVAAVLKSPKTALPALLAVVLCVAALLGCTFTGQSGALPTEEEVTALLHKAEAVYQMGNNELLEIVSYEEMFMVEGVEGPVYYDEIGNYDQTVAELFTQQGLEQLEKSRYFGLAPAIRKEDGKVYRASGLDDSAATRYYDTISAVELLEQEDGRFTYQISHTAKTRWEETEDMTSRLVLVRQKGKLLVESFDYPPCETANSSETVPVEESQPVMQPGVLYALTDGQASSFPSKRTEAGQDELERWEEIIHAGTISRFDGRTMGERGGVITAEQGEQILLTLQNARLGLLESMGNPSTGGQLELVAYDAAGAEQLHCLYDGSWFMVQFAEEPTAYVFNGSVAGWSELEALLSAAAQSDSQPLDEENARQTINAILQSFVITAEDGQQEGTVRFTVPDTLPQLPQDVALYATLNLTYSTGAGSSRVDSLLDWATGWQPGQQYSAHWQQATGEKLVGVMLRMAYMTDQGDQSFREYAAGYTELSDPIPFGQSATLPKAELTAEGQSFRVSYTAADGQTAEVSMTLLRGTELVPDDGRQPLFKVYSNGAEIGSLKLIGYGTTAQSDLQSVDPAGAALPMQIYSPIALANHVDYQSGYRVVEATATASRAVCRMRYQSLGESAGSAANAPWLEQDCILAFDLAARPMFVSIQLAPDTLPAAELEAWTKTIRFEQ